MAYILSQADSIRSEFNIPQDQGHFLEASRISHMSPSISSLNGTVYIYIKKESDCFLRFPSQKGRRGLGSHAHAFCFYGRIGSVASNLLHVIECWHVRRGSEVILGENALLRTKARRTTIEHCTYIPAESALNACSITIRFFNETASSTSLTTMSSGHGTLLYYVRCETRTSTRLRGKHPAEWRNKT